ncbi:Platinum sensitivity protein [Coemansia sp. Benny D115]|nr:Platinum sensitivity protein [Coemansia sp. Benny D115]
MTPAESQVRVKVYQLEKNSVWADKGTGFCTLEDYQGVLHLNVVSETEVNRMILDCVVQRGEVYQQQEATLIVWTEPTGEDMALSFQEQEGCVSILNQINEFENAMEGRSNVLFTAEAATAPASRPRHQLTSAFCLVERANGSSPPAPAEEAPPQPSIAALPEIRRIITEAGRTHQMRDRVVTHISSTDFVPQLCAVYEACVDLEATEELHSLFDIVRQMILLNDSSIIECFTKEENILSIVGMLEHDPQQRVSPGTFRDYLAEGSRYREVVPIEDPEMQDKIHQTFRLQYLKDVVLPHVLDEGYLSMINTLIYFNIAQIASYVQHNQKLLRDLFDILHDSEDREKRRSVVMFVRQLCSVTKALPVQFRIVLYRVLSQHGLFGIFEFAFQEDDDDELQAAAADILLIVLELDRALVRSYALAQSMQQKKNTNLVDLVIQGTKQGIGSEVQMQCCEILRIMLDVIQQQPLQQQVPSQQQQQQQAMTDDDAMDHVSAELKSSSPGEGNDMDNFLALFYSTYAHTAMEPLLLLTPKLVAKLSANDRIASLLLFLCEMISSSVRFHGFRARSFVFSSDIAKNIVLLLQARPNHLKLSALRFIRACVAVQDDSYNKYLVGHRLFDPVIQLFLQVSARDNLVSSACRELFKFVASNRIASLLSHLINVHARALAQTKDILDILRTAYTEHLEEVERIKAGAVPVTPTVSAVSAGMGVGGRRDVVSVNSLLGMDRIQDDIDTSANPRGGSGSNSSSGSNSATGMWMGIGGLAADEMEDAYLESSDEDISPIAGEEMAVLQSPELKGLQDLSPWWAGN